MGHWIEDLVAEQREEVEQNKWRLAWARIGGHSRSAHAATSVSAYLAYGPERRATADRVA